MELPQIIRCDANECAFNQGEKCHAMAITVGGPVDHQCDTFLRSASKGGVAHRTALVGACKVTSCKHNNALECSAPGVNVGHEGSEIDCLTFAAK